MRHNPRHVEEPVYLDPDIGARLSPGTVGIRLPITRFVCKFKMSQDKDPRASDRCSKRCSVPAPTTTPSSRTKCSGLCIQMSATGRIRTCDYGHRGPRVHHREDQRFSEFVAREKSEDAMYEAPGRRHS
jgi:hypothetical protein